MPKCQACQDEVDEVLRFKMNGKMRRLCEVCVEIAEEEAEISDGAYSAMKDMMEYKGR